MNTNANAQDMSGDKLMAQQPTRNIKTAQGMHNMSTGGVSTTEVANGGMSNKPGSIDVSKCTTPNPNQLVMVQSSVAVVNQGMGDGRMTMEEYFQSSRSPDQGLATTLLNPKRLNANNSMVPNPEFGFKPTKNISIHENIIPANMAQIPGIGPEENMSPNYLELRNQHKKRIVVSQQSGESSMMVPAQAMIGPNGKVIVQNTKNKVIYSSAADKSPGQQIPSKMNLEENNVFGARGHTLLPADGAITRTVTQMISNSENDVGSPKSLTHGNSPNNPVPKIVQRYDMIKIDEKQDDFGELSNQDFNRMKKSVNMSKSQTSRDSQILEV